MRGRAGILGIALGSRMLLSLKFWYFSSLVGLKVKVSVAVMGKVTDMGSSWHIRSIEYSPFANHSTPTANPHRENKT